MYEHIKKVFQYDLSGVLISNIPWKQVKWNANRYLPRMVSSLSIDELIEKVPEMVEVVSYLGDKYHIQDSVWMNYYRDGSDYTPYHKDSYNCIVACVSFGGSRIFKIRNDTTKNEQSFNLENGDIFVFDQEFNNTHQHSIMRTTKRVDPRVSLVFFCLPK